VLEGVKKNVSASTANLFVLLVTCLSYFPMIYRRELCKSNYALLVGCALPTEALLFTAILSGQPLLCNQGMADREGRKGSRNVCSL
jgi:hypothetical protein